MTNSFNDIQQNPRDNTISFSSGEEKFTFYPCDIIKDGQPAGKSTITLTSANNVRKSFPEQHLTNIAAVAQGRNR